MAGGDRLLTCLHLLNGLFRVHLTGFSGGIQAAPEGPDAGFCGCVQLDTSGISVAFLAGEGRSLMLLSSGTLGAFSNISSEAGLYCGRSGSMFSFVSH